MGRKTAVGRAIIEGRVLEILAAHIKGGLSTHLLRDELNRTDYRGAAASWFKVGFSTKEVSAILKSLFKRGLVKRLPNGKFAMVWFLNGGVGVIPKPPKRSYWGEPRLFRFSEGRPAWLK